MSKSNIQFLSSVLVLSIFGTTSVWAAPSVRMLGTNTARVGSNAAVVKSSNSNNTATTQRLGSIRAQGISTGTPVSVNKVPSKINTIDSGAAEESRLSLGKYIHNTGVAAGTIKPSTTGTTAADVASNEFTNLVDRVQNLEQGKQDAITLGEGLVMDGNKISLDSAVLQDQIEENVATALGDAYYTADEIDEILEESGVSVGGPTYTSITNQQNVYNDINIADEFDSEGFDFEE